MKVDIIKTTLDYDLYYTVYIKKHWYTITKVLSLDGVGTFTKPYKGYTDFQSLVAAEKAAEAYITHNTKSKSTTELARRYNV